jgi:hypothetical protein
MYYSPNWFFPIDMFLNVHVLNIIKYKWHHVSQLSFTVTKTWESVGWKSLFSSQFWCFSSRSGDLWWDRASWKNHVSIKDPHPVVPAVGKERMPVLSKAMLSWNSRSWEPINIHGGKHFEDSTILSVLNSSITSVRS